MKLLIDTEKGYIEVEKSSHEIDSYDLYGKDSFEILSYLWIKLGWNQKYTYTFSWMGRPIIQLPEDMVRIQEVIYQIKPDVIIETGIAHGGSLIFYASLCKAMGKGRIIGIDIDIRSHNRKAIEEHVLFSFVTLLEGNSTEKTILDEVNSLVKSDEKVFVILDSDHSKEHVMDELNAYHGLVTLGSYIVVTDGIMKDVHDVPRGSLDWEWNNPTAAAKEFVKHHPEFVIQQPRWRFNESKLTKNVTHWPSAWLKRVKYT